MTTTHYGEHPSVPVACAACGGNTWHVFEGERLPDGHVWVRLRCGAAGCPRRGHARVIRRWLPGPEPAR